LIPDTDLEELRELAIEFAACFANAGPDKVGNHVEFYAKVLLRASKMRRTVAETWEAFGKARLLKSGVPLFKAQANDALNFLTYRPRNEPMPVQEDDGVPWGDACEIAEDFVPYPPPPWELNRPAGLIAAIAANAARG
jgi:hypothetical protein